MKIDSFTTFLPFLPMILGNGSNFAQFIPMLFLIPMIWDKLQDFYYWMIKPKNTITIIQKTDKKKGFDQINFAYESICYYFDVLKNDNPKYKRDGEDLNCDRSKLGYNIEYEDGDGDRWCKYEPIFTPCGRKSVEWKTNNLQFHFYEDDLGKNVVISGAHIDVLKDFVNICITQYEMHLYIKKDDKNYIYNYVKDDEKWDGKEIRVNKTFDNIFLPKTLKDKLQHDIDEFINNETFYKKVGIPYKRGYLLKGVPGTGKSSTVYALAKHLGWNIYKPSPKYFTRNDMRKAMSLIPPKSIVLIEEVDTHVENNRDKTKKFKSPIVKKDDDDDVVDISTACDPKLDLSEMLDIIDGYEYLHSCIVIFTTNYPDRLDAALIRAGRMDLHFTFGLLQRNEVIEAINFFVGPNDISVPDDIEIESAKLLNEILIPNRNNPQVIQKYLSNDNKLKTN